MLNKDAPKNIAINPPNKANISVVLYNSYLCIAM